MAMTEALSAVRLPVIAIESFRPDGLRSKRFVEPAWQTLRAVHAAWRRLAWGLTAEPPRVWRT